MSEYSRFYWPLALTGIVTLLANQLQNAALARYPNAAYELATFAIATGVFHLFDAALIFMPQMVNVFARSRPSARLCLRFTWRLCLGMTVLVVLLAVPPIGRPLLGRIFHIRGPQLDDVMLYLALLSPNIVLLGLRHYYTGLIVQTKRTGWVTTLNVMYVGVIGVMLVFGRAWGWRALVTLAIAPLLASVLHLAASRSIAERLGAAASVSNTAGDVPTTREIVAFFWPVALTSVMFSLSRPILYLFLARLPEAVPVIASMRVGFDFALIFHNLLNQFRHLFVTFGAEHLAGIRRFMLHITGLVVALMVGVVWTPASEWILRSLIGLQGDVLVRSRDVLRVMCLIPAVVAWRNYFHGLAMVRRRTGPMGLGAVMRNAATYLFSALLFRLGGLNHVTAAFILVLGFLAETLTVIYDPALRRHRI